MALRILLLLLVLGTAIPAAAQTTRPAAIVEGVFGWAGFIDEAWIDHTMYGAGARLYVRPRLAIGPEFLVLDGPPGDVDWTLMGTVTFDLRHDSSGATPYLVVGAGYLRTYMDLGSQWYSSGEWITSGGVGVRIPLGRRFFVAPELRIGYEPELRFGVTIGIRPGR